MELVKATGITLNTGSKDLFNNVSFRLLEDHKYGLIGANGSGKTTLVRLILGELKPDKGSLYIKPNLKIGYLPQQPDYQNNQTLGDLLVEELAPLMEEMEKLERIMADPKTVNDPEGLEKILSKYQQISEKFEISGGYQALDRGETLLRRLGLDNPLSQPMGSLSGGERSLVFFARALLSQPDLLILDEPGNHLDYLGLAWLETFLAGYPGTVLIISHNRYLLEKCCTTLLDLENAGLTEFKGTYSHLRTVKFRKALIEQDAYEASQKLQEKLTKRIKELQSIAMSQYNPPATVMSQLGAAQAKLEAEKQRNLERPRFDESVTKLDFGEELSRAAIALEVKNFTYGFEDKMLFKEASLKIHCREKVALVGPNGSGKSTFLQVLLKEGDWSSGGNLRLGPSQKVGYLSQVPKFKKGAVTIEDEIRSWGALSRDGAYALARHFSFSYEDLDKHLTVLSGGELNRLQLAKLMYLKTNFLILDEPTNHMDIQSREMIEEAVGKFPGTVLVVSHDRFFLDQLVDRVVEIENGQFHSYPGNFSDYFREKYPVLPRLSGDTARRGKERQGSDRKTSETQSGGTTGLVAQVERRIQEAENEKTLLETELKKAYEAKDRKGGLRLAAQLDKLAGRLEKLYRQWETLE